MVKRKLLIPVVVGLACLFGLAGTAFAAPAPSKPAQPTPAVVVHPDFTATGGGCNTVFYAYGGYIEDKACISGAGNLLGYNIYPDGYVSFPTVLEGGWSNCFVTLRLLDNTNGTNPETSYFPCTTDANTGQYVHYVLQYWHSSGNCPERFQTELSISGDWGGNPLNINEYSPTETIQC